MKEFTATENDAGQRLDRFAAKAVPGIPSSLLQRYFRTKDIKLNGHWARPDARVRAGDVIRLYLPDDLFAGQKPAGQERALSGLRPKLDILYEDRDILLVNKLPGVLCHSAGTWDPNTLLAHIQAHAYQAGEWDPSAENSFAPALCNRIDRGTGGIVIAAKNAAALRILDEKIRTRELIKEYLCVCLGRPDPAQGRLQDQLFKDAEKKLVYVRARPEPGSSLAVTDYCTLRSNGSLSLLECRLHTGRTHQIRVQLAHAGHPLLGDGKYGIERINRRYGESRQLLWSYKLTFAFSSGAGPLDRLNGQCFEVENVPFRRKYFPDA